MSRAAEATALRLAEQLPIDGRSSQTLCPVCEGGRSRELSFVVGRASDHVWWKCFRATCPGATGRSGSYMLPEATQERQLRRLSPYMGEARPLGVKDFQYFQDRFGLLSDVIDRHIGVTEHDEYLLPFRSYASKLRGYTVRQPVWSGNPQAPRAGREGERKVRTYMETMDAAVGWYHAGHRLAIQEPHRQRTIVVEDQISALKVAQCGGTVACIMGSGFNTDIVRDLAAHQSPGGIVLALDPDAQKKAQDIRLRWGGYFEKCRIVALEADPKDLPADDLREALGL